MSCLGKSVKQYYQTRCVQYFLACMLIVSVTDPLFICFIGKESSLFQTTGENPFQYWLLMNHVGFGGRLYFNLFFILPTLSTGLILFNEKRTSIYTFTVIREGRKSYLFSRSICIFGTTFLNFFTVLSLNLILTYAIFSSNAPLTEQYKFFIPNVDSFAYLFYKISPFMMAIFYVFLNALTLALLSLMAQCIHMIFSFKNIFAALVFPTIFMYSINYMVGTVLKKDQYAVSVILQPRAASLLTRPSTFTEVIATLFIILLINLILLYVADRRSFNIL